MKVAVIGAAGRTGRRVVDECASRGWDVAALARDRTRVTAHPAVEVIEGDAQDASAIANAVAGCGAVVSCLGMRDIEKPSTEFSDAVKTIVRCARDAGVRRVIAIASALALPHRAGGLRADHGVPAFLRHVAAEHRRNYETLRDSGLDWTLMCPVDLKDDIPAGHARIAYDDLPSGSDETGYADLARTIVDLVADRASVGKRVGIVSVR